MTTAILHEEILKKVGEFNLKQTNVPEYITNNLKLKLWDFQKDALRYFLIYNDEKYRNSFDIKTNHFLFNMATGTGKTLLMASLILYHYQNGYRNFIFVVNQKNIITKTEDNFTHLKHDKYLFNQHISLNGKFVTIRKVNTFSKNTNEIQIKFTTIQKLHNDIYKPAENSVCLEDLQKRDIVILADEAHHFNTSTKSSIESSAEFKDLLSEKASKAKIEKSWENTIVHKLLNKQGYKGRELNKNVLIEFTATLPKNNEKILQKYASKLIFKYDIIDFVSNGYTKEVNLVKLNYNKKNLILSAD